MRRDIFKPLIERLQKAVQALTGDVQLDERQFSFPAYQNNTLQQLTIQTNAYRQLQRFLSGRIGSQAKEIPYSEKYLRWRQKVGLPGRTWTLVKTGILYQTLKYTIKKGELYTEYSDARKNAIKSLNETARFHVLNPTKEEIKDMTKEIALKRLSKFIEAFKKR